MDIVEEVALYCFKRPAAIHDDDYCDDDHYLPVRILSI